MQANRAVAIARILLLVGLAALPGLAQEKPGSKAEPVKDAPKFPVPRVSEASYARSMALNGEAIQDPYLLIQAAQVFITAGKLPGPKGELKDSASAREKKTDQDPATLLRHAAGIAAANGDRKALEMAAEVARNKVIGLGDNSLADEISKIPVARGFAADHSWKGSGCLNNGDSVSWEVPFRGGEEAAVAIKASSPVESFISDSYGEVLRDDAYSSVKYMRWRTIVGGPLRVTLRAGFGQTCYSIHIP